HDAMSLTAILSFSIDGAGGGDDQLVHRPVPVVDELIEQLRGAEPIGPLVPFHRIHGLPGARLRGEMDSHLLPFQRPRQCDSIGYIRLNEANMWREILGQRPGRMHLRMEVIEDSNLVPLRQKSSS